MNHQDEGRIDPFDSPQDFDASCVTGDERAYECDIKHPDRGNLCAASSPQHAESYCDKDEGHPGLHSDGCLGIAWPEMLGVDRPYRPAQFDHLDDNPVAMPDPVFGEEGYVFDGNAPKYGVVSAAADDVPEGRGKYDDETGEVNAFVEPAPDTKPTNPKDAIGSRKPGLRAVPMTVMFEVGAALCEGEVKYGRHNYRAMGVRASVYFDALFRHMGVWWEGEDIDEASGLSHVTKAIAGLTVLRDSMIQGNWVDDRPIKAPSGWLEPIADQTTELLERYPNPVEPFLATTELSRGDPAQYRIEVSLPVRDQTGDIYEFAETDLNLEIRDEEHGLALVDDLATNMYRGRWVNLFVGDDMLYGSREPAANLPNPVAGGSSSS